MKLSAMFMTHYIFFGVCYCTIKIPKRNIKHYFIERTNVSFPIAECMFVIARYLHKLHNDLQITSFCILNTNFPTVNQCPLVAIDECDATSLCCPVAMCSQLFFSPSFVMEQIDTERMKAR